MSAYLVTHVIVRGPVEVSVGPACELVLLELLRGTVILEGELSVGLQELGNLHFV